MLEIIALIAFGKKLASMAAEKGRSKGWAALGVAFWLGGELMGGVVATLLGFDGLGLYGFAILAAGIGIFVAFMIVKSLPPLMPASTGGMAV